MPQNSTNYKYILLFFLISFYTLSSINHNEEVKTNLRWTILPLNNGENVFKQCSRATPKYKKVIAFDESIYLNAIKLLNEKTSSFKKKTSLNIEKYTLQLIGFIHKNKRYIYINASTTILVFESKKKWQENPIIWCDGSSSSWGMVYDISQHKLINFLTNGPKVIKVDEI